MKSLDPDSAESLRTAVQFAKSFSIDVLRMTPEAIVGIDDVPTIALFIETTSKYTGPPIHLNRLKTLCSRIGAGTIEIASNKAGNPSMIVIKKGRTTVDFCLANVAQGKRLPGAFSGSFLHDITIPRDDFDAILAGVADIRSVELTLKYTDGLSVTSSNGGETFKYDLSDINLGRTEQFSFTYSTTHLLTIGKLLPQSKPFTAQITPRGQMMVTLSADNVTAKAFILDIKKR